MSDLFDPLAFSVGMVALLNPCGFALLPAYLGFFLNQDEGEDTRGIVALNRAQGVGLAMTLGFLAVFGVLGLVFSTAWTAIVDWLPYFNIALGLGLVLLGVAMFRGYRLKLTIPSLQAGSRSTSFGSMFLFGVSYALASLSCTIGIFLIAVSSSSTGASGFFDDLGGFVSYGLGMGMLATVLTIAVAFGRNGLINRFRRFQQHINHLSALLLLVVGPYMVLYGIWELQILNRGFGEVTPWIDTIVSNALDFQADINTWITGDASLGAVTVSRINLLGWTFFALNAGLLIAGYAARRAGPGNRSQDRQVTEPAVPTPQGSHR